MNKKENFKKLEPLLTESVAENLMYEDLNEALYQLQDNTPEEIALFDDVKMVYHYGGEGAGERYETVWYFPKLDIYVEFFGWYYSYDGANYDSYYLVEPKEVMVTQYHRIN